MKQDNVQVETNLVSLFNVAETLLTVWKFTRHLATQSRCQLRRDSVRENGCRSLHFSFKRFAKKKA